MDKVSKGAVGGWEGSGCQLFRGKKVEIYDVLSRRQEKVCYKM